MAPDIRAGVYFVSVLDIRHILKRYGTIHALSDVSLTVDRSEIVAVVGEDGAGKSTTLVRCIAAMVDLLNAGITPVIPEYGSLGAGGDLAPLADAALALLGEGDVVYEGSVRPAADALRAAALAPIELAEKEGSPSPTASLACSASPSLIPYASDAGRHDCGDDCRRTACHRRNVFC